MLFFDYTPFVHALKHPENLFDLKRTIQKVLSDTEARNEETKSD
jgi:hypothetical protein